MRSSEQETGYLNVREVISAAARQRELYLASTLKDSSLAWAGPAVLALLFAACVAYVAVDGGIDAQSPAQAQIAVAMAAPPWAGDAVPARGIPAAVAVPAAATSLPTYNSNPVGDGNVLTYEHD